MDAHQKLAAKDLEDISRKIAWLILFMHGDDYVKLSTVEQGLLMVQLVAMQNYESALTRRIELF